MPPDTFPTKLSVESEGAFSWLWNLFSQKPLNTISIPKYTDKPDAIDLASSLQYSMVSGLPQLKKFCMEFSKKIFQPAYSNFTTILHAGNTDGCAKTVTTLCNAGEGVLCDEWTYPSALALMRPYGISAVAVDMDHLGMSSKALRELLSSWNQGARGMTRYAFHQPI